MSKVWEFIFIGMSGFAVARATFYCINADFKTALFHFLASLIFLIGAFNEKQEKEEEKG